MLGPIDDWRDVLKYAWSIRVAVFWGIVSGAYVALPVFADWIGPLWFAAFCIIMSVALVWARLTKQPGMN